MKKSDSDRLSPLTQTIHAGQNPDREYGSVSPPIYQTSTFRFDSAEQGSARFAGTQPGYIYTRLGNPTVAQLEEKIAVLEQGQGALATASGMAAISTVFFALLEKGAHLVGTEALYGPSRMIVERDFSRFGVESDFVNTSDLDAIKRAIRPSTKMLFIETPTNPTIQLTDLEACAKIAREHNLILVVDNTFLTPVFQRPLTLGADIVVHSATKFINGHTDVVGGIIVTRSLSMRRRLAAVLQYLGGTMDPHQAWMILRGSKTLGLRVKSAEQNAQVIARQLENHPQHDLACRQSEGFGSLLAFELHGGIQAGRSLLDGVSLCTLAVSLGGIETLIQHPASMTHAGVPIDQRRQAGISDGLVRLSVGCEQAEDLWADLQQALDQV